MILSPCSLLLTAVVAVAGSTMGQLPPREPRPPDTPMPLAGRTVVLSVDDGYHTVFTNIYPLLKRHGMTMTLGVICDYLRDGNPSYRPSGGFLRRSEIQELVDSCHIEVASHSLSHPFLTRLDSTAAWREILESRVLLESLFGGEVLTFVYPYGDMNSRVARMVQTAGYRMGRAVRSGRFDLASDPWRLPIVELRREIDPASIRQAILSQEVTVLLLHQIVERPRVFTEWALDDFAELLDWLDRGGARVTTLRQLYYDWWNNRMNRFMDEVAVAFADDRKQLLFKDVDVDATEAPHPR